MAVESASPTHPARPAARVILHLDMDAFYASVEQRDRPELRGRPVIVGSPPDQRGVVCAASYEARNFGVRSAMPSRTAGRLCPEGVFVRPRMEEYRTESREIFRLVAATGVTVEQVSVDEAYLEATELVPRALRADLDTALRWALPLAEELKRTIRAQRQLTASVGIAGNKLLAKLASDYRKPDGLMLIPDGDKAAFLRPLPVRALHGVGRVTEVALVGAGLATVGSLQDYPGDLRHIVGPWGPGLKRFAFGEDDRALELGDEVKGISSETTFERDTADRPTLRAALREHADDIARKLQRRHLWAKTVRVKVRYGDFTTLTRQFSVDEPVVEPRDIYRLGCWLLAQHQLVSRPLRLLGLGVSGLAEAEARQLRLPLEKQPELSNYNVCYIHHCWRGNAPWPRV
jgi:DNA polymerase-4